MKTKIFILLLLKFSNFHSQCDVTITTPGYNGSDVSCFGMCNANIFSNCNGIGPYSFNWSTGETTANLFGRCPGEYVLTITDGSGCIAIDTLEIIEPSELNAEIIVSNPLSIYANCTGSLYGTGSGGTPNSDFPWYDFTWFDCTTEQPNAIQSSVLPNLCEGNYGLVITDANGCLDSICFNFEIDTCAYVSSSYTIGGLDCHMGVFGISEIESYQWVNCDDSYSPFLGDTLEYYTSSYGGNVAVIIYAFGCADTSYCQDVCFYGIDELSNNTKKVIRIIDPLGNEVPEEPNRILIFIYNDGTTKKVFKVE